MRFRTVLSGVVVAACLAVATACEPLPPAPVFTINDTGALPDAVPGDGTCEATPGGGDCTLLAAVEEGNALGQAEIVLIQDQPLVHDLTVSGAVTIMSDSEDRHRLEWSGVGPRSVVVAAGGSLTLRSIGLGASVQVHGRLSGVDSSVFAFSGPAIDVRPGGVAAVATSTLTAVDTRAVRNEGAALVAESKIGVVHLVLRLGGLVELHHGGVDTRPGASTYLRNTWLASNRGSACTGDAPISLGGNRAPDTTCDLHGTGDVEDAPQDVNGP
jgi:hypothetical protein